ncbi:YesL family protein [Aquibacillus rhizosphaerae]|uniref:YesL family protein n=1 Tax=Aquibacillus rhizosphaerae TaxID=3051431 RepID=A0ABT7L364_9BACI|nr:YesL family protein [Aquibacillus sp. LR5S19]MDL4839035.1 YesL family protein [Aquibacillus sp. LR5S19]
MNGKSIATTLDRVMQWVTRLALLNIFWILFSISGLLIVGIFPATSAALGVSRKWLTGEHDIKIWKTFKRIFREEFVSSNIIGWILTLLGGLFYLNYRVMLDAGSEIMVIIPFAFYLVIFLFLIIVLWVFPLNVHNYASIIQQFKNAFIIGIAKLHITITMMLLLFSIMFFSLDFPVLLFFFTFSLSALVWMWLSLRVFSKVLDNPKEEL